MTTLEQTANIETSPSKKWNIGLWVAQIALAGLFSMGVYMHLFLSPAELAAMGAGWAESVPVALIRFIGIAELAGVVGLILPALTRIKPNLTVYAAKGLLLIQVLAIIVHVSRGEFSVLPFNLIFVALALVIIWGRKRKAIITAKS